MTASPEASHLTRLLPFIRDLEATPDLELFLNRLVGAAATLTDSERASILILNEDGNTLSFRAALPFRQEIIDTLSVPLDASLAGWVFMNNEPLIVQDVSQDSRHYKLIDQVENFQTISLLTVPIIHRGEVIGVFEVVNKNDNTHYTEDDVSVLEILAFYAAMALWNARLETGSQAMGEQSAELDKLKKDFIAITSHELRTPLGIILGHATFLKELVGIEHQEPVDTIIRNASRLKEIIESLTNEDNYETGVSTIRQNMVAIPELVIDVVSSFQDMAARKNITLNSKVKNQLPQIEADINKISVALSNLVRNALIFTNEGGHVLVTAESIPGQIQVSVIDDGIGIPENELQRVFERFFQVEGHLTRRHSGMGLGLSVAKTMIELHGGRIWAESVHGQGSTFIFTLPLTPSQAQATSSPAFIS